MVQQAIKLIDLSKEKDDRVINTREHLRLSYLGAKEMATLGEIQSRLEKFDFPFNADYRFDSDDDRRDYQHKVTMDAWNVMNSDEYIDTCNGNDDRDIYTRAAYITHTILSNPESPTLLAICKLRGINELKVSDIVYFTPAIARYICYILFGVDIMEAKSTYDRMKLDEAEGIKPKQTNYNLKKQRSVYEQFNKPKRRHFPNDPVWKPGKNRRPRVGVSRKVWTRQ